MREAQQRRCSARQSKTAIRFDNVATTAGVNVTVKVAGFRRRDRRQLADVERRVQRAAASGDDEPAARLWPALANRDTDFRGARTDRVPHLINGFFRVRPAERRAALET